MLCLWQMYRKLPCSTWWRHQMETFYVLLALCAGNSPVTGEFPAQKPVTRNFDVFFDLRLNKWLSKQSLGWWFEMPSCSLWRQCNEQEPIWLLITLSRGWAQLNPSSLVLETCFTLSLNCLKKPAPAHVKNILYKNGLKTKISFNLYKMWKLLYSQYQTNSFDVS